jgi:hypothetical protein
VRGLFTDDAYMALEVCDTRDFNGTLAGGYARLASALPYAMMADE